MKKFPLIALIIFMIISACSMKDNLINPNDPVQLEVKAGISIEPTSKAIVSGTIFSDGTKIGVQVLKNTDGSAYETGALTNLEVTYALVSTSWILSGFNLTSTQGKVYAYHPYASQGTNYEPFSTIRATLPATSNTGLDTDYMYATPLTGESVLVSNADGKNSASLTMNHALAQVSFVVYKENYPGLGTFTQFKIEDAAETSWIKLSKATDDDLEMDITNGAITGGEKGVLTRTLTTPVTLLNTPPSVDEATLRSQVNASTLVTPTTLMAAGDIKFTFTIDGKSSTVVTTSPISWQAGKQYIYKVKLSGTSISISSVTIADWTTVIVDEIVIY